MSSEIRSRVLSNETSSLLWALLESVCVLVCNSVQNEV